MRKVTKIPFCKDFFLNQIIMNKVKRVYTDDFLYYVGSLEEGFKTGERLAVKVKSITQTTYGSVKMLREDRIIELYPKVINHLIIK